MEESKFSHDFETGMKAISNNIPKAIADFKKLRRSYYMRLAAYWIIWGLFFLSVYLIFKN